nr:ATP-binding cassette domain-containing protein [Candidatus Collinsella stercoripullorum]
MISIQHVCKTYDVPKKGPRRPRRAVLDAAAPASAQSASPVPAAAAATAATAEAIAAASGPDGTVRALDDICLEIADGDIFGIIGMSGAGKSTLVRTINLLERPTSGSIVVDGVDVTGLTGAQLREYRRRVAMIFQNFGLLAQKTVLDNVCFPFLAAAGKVTDADRERALSLLERVGLREKASSYPSQLSGGQQQRVAIARALACDPEVILCDEATSALDPKSTNTILKLLRDINRETGVTLVVITHSMDVVEKICRNVAVLEAGRVVEQGSVEQVFADPRADATRVLLGKVEWDA